MGLRAALRPQGPQHLRRRLPLLPAPPLQPLGLSPRLVTPFWPSAVRAESTAKQNGLSIGIPCLPDVRGLLRRPATNSRTSLHAAPASRASQCPGMHSHDPCIDP